MGKRLNLTFRQSGKVGVRGQAFRLSVTQLGGATGSILVGAANSARDRNRQIVEWSSKTP